MQNRQTGRRRRGGGGGSQPRPLNQPMAGQGGSRLENRVRGNASQLLEKYKQLARDAHQAGDRVAAEYYLQHAEHYFRVLNDARIRQEEMRSRRGAFDPVDDEFDEEGDVRAGGAGGVDRPFADVVREANGHGPRAERSPEDEGPAIDEAEAEAPEIGASAALARMSDGEAALVAFGGARGLADRDEPGARAEGDEPGDPPRPARRRGRPRKASAPAIEG